MNRNLDDHVPVSSIISSGVLIDRELKIFWGPGQLVDDQYADVEKWRKDEVLNIPNVSRLIWAAQSAYDSDAYSNGPTSPPIEVPPVPPPGTPRTWRYELTPFYRYLLDPVFFADKDYYPIVLLAADNFTAGIFTPDPYNIRGVSFFVSTLAVPAADNPGIKVLSSSDSSEKYSGPIKGYGGIYGIGSRQINWISDNPPNSPLSILIYSNMNRGEDPTIAPRCYYWVPALSMFSSEVTPAAREFYGCSTSPPPPPAPPPP